MIYEVCKQVIMLKAYESAESYQERLNMLFALEGLSVEQYKELSELLQKM